jgi:C4-dicarboxylate-specific signal transduction histidine kinase
LLQDLEKQLDEIGEIPIVAPLSLEDATESVHINELIMAYVERKREHDRFKDIHFALDLSPEIDAGATVRASRAWLRQLLDIFLDNAEYEMRRARVPEKCLGITSRLTERQVEVVISDNGSGIPGEVLDKLYEEPIIKAQGSRGAGLGLLHAKVIVSTYGGRLPLPNTSDAGTAFTIIFPAEATA